MLTVVELAAEVTEVDPNGVTPGVIGFVATAIVGVASIFLIIDMNRRMRRIRYREEAKINVDAEEAVERLIESTRDDKPKK